MALQARPALVIIVALLAGLVSAGDPPGRRIPESEFPLEVEDQPPAKESARDNLAARSSGMRVAVGPYISVQVNVDSLGHNIVGDAANEPSIAVNPVNPDNMVVSSIPSARISARAGGRTRSTRVRAGPSPGCSRPGRSEAIR